MTTRERARFGWESLTTTERNVTDLVVQGLTNREVAKRLFQSPHTVDSHLRSIFRKLDIRSRVDLTRVALLHQYELLDEYELTGP
jgi:DNA-binding CsgD family transcriptional regulator